MATETVATNPDPEVFGAEPVHGNFTTDAGTHLWCAHALSLLVASPDEPLSTLNDDLQQAVRYLLECEIGRARKAEQAGK